MNRTVTACLFEGPFEELPTWQEMLDAGAGRLSAAGVAEAELDAWYLLSDSFSVDRVHFLMDRNRTVHPGTFEKGWPVFAERIGRRLSEFLFSRFWAARSLWGFPSRSMTRC